MALLYLWLIAPRLLPDRATELDNASPRLSHGWLSETSAATGLTVAEARTLADTEVTIRRILRDDATLIPLPDVRLYAGDRLRLFDTPTNLHTIATALGGELYSEASEQPVSEDNPLSAGEQRLAELAVAWGGRSGRREPGKTTLFNVIDSLYWRCIARP